MKTLLARLAAVALAAAACFLSSCVAPYGAGTLGRGIDRGTASPPLLATALSRDTRNVQANHWMFANSRYDPCYPGYRSYRGTGLSFLFTRHARPYYANYGWGRPYHGSSWYGYPYTSQWRYPGYTRYHSYGSPYTSYGWPMSHYGGWSYIYRPTYWPTSTCYNRYGW